MPDSKLATTNQPMLTIGAVSRATGIPVETLRTWERRYGPLDSSRRPSGHRLYPLSAVARLRRVAAALVEGHRPAQVLRLGDLELETLLLGAERRRAHAPASSGLERRRKRLSEAAAGGPDEWMAHVQAFDSMRLRLALEARGALQPAVEFLESTIRPFMEDIGRRWQNGSLEVRHEHFATATVTEVLAALRRRHPPAAGAPHVATAMLPGDRHQMGMVMAGMVFAAAGWNVVDLGPDTPARQLVALAEEAGLDAVAISRSATAPPAALQELRVLGRELRPGTRLILGGSGDFPRLARARRFRALSELSRWAVSEARRSASRSAPADR